MDVTIDGKVIGETYSADIGFAEFESTTYYVVTFEIDGKEVEGKFYPDNPYKVRELIKTQFKKK